MFAKYNGSDLAFQIGTETAGATLRPLDFVTGGSRRMTIGTTGNVGIGTTAPNGVLHAVGTSFNTAAIIERGQSNTDAAFGVVKILSTKTSDMQNGFGSSMLFAIQDNAGVQNIIGSIGCVRAGADNTGDLVFSPVSSSIDSERMRITAAGNVGIGTTAPSSKLQVTGGDVEIETVTSGIIMKAAGTSTRYRITLNATGDALVFTAV
jgi:hypothetical protein